ncbi:MAG: DUF1934 domain-containing protein [Lachnospiraceae bacterium]|nr:DUF1934 domain-containing protein [Lachnospiraceae bacterium]
MKVNLEYESIDGTGEKSSSKVFALMEIRATDYKLVFVEDLSGEGHMTRSTMYISEEGLRIIRQGELNTDFMFGPDLVHNTVYDTPYGRLPVTLTTQDYNFFVSHPFHREDDPFAEVNVPEDFSLVVSTEYMLQVDAQDTMPMSIQVKVSAV